MNAEVDQSDSLGEAPGPKTWAVRTLLVVLGLAGWFGTQSLLGARAATSDEATQATAGAVLVQGDALHEALSSLHAFLDENRPWAHALLIASSLAIDMLGVFLLAWSIFGRSIRPFVGLLLLFGLRQLCQSLCALPQPAGMIWEDPGFPSLLVTYDVANDFFFSGHTALAVYGAIELGRWGGRPLRVVALLIAVFLALTVIALRAHYTLDVYAGAITALLAAMAAQWLAPYCDRAIAVCAGRNP